MEYLMSVDSLIALVTGAIIGGVSERFMRGLGLVGNVVVGLIGGVIGGLVFDAINILNVGDIADPIIAGLVGAVVVLAIVAVVRRTIA